MLILSSLLLSFFFPLDILPMYLVPGFLQYKGFSYHTEPPQWPLKTPPLCTETSNAWRPKRILNKQPFYLFLNLALTFGEGQNKPI